MNVIVEIKKASAKKAVVFIIHKSGVFEPGKLNWDVIWHFNLLTFLLSMV